HGYNLIKQYDLKEDAEYLGKLFINYQSDKYTHGYEIIYAYVSNILLKKNNIKKVLEFGLGTKDPKMPSTMAFGKVDNIVGGSLRAWRDYFPNAKIYGADIDKATLFQEERIETHFVDSLEQRTLDNLLVTIGGEFDVMIDDALHYPNANLNSLLFALRALKIGGVLVIEDISERMLSFWQMIGCILPKTYGYKIIKSDHFMVVVQKK
ncbi:MAG: hypothetical protein ACR2NY_05565, partial [Alphaproteobacteria bacterium]